MSLTDHGGTATTEETLEQLGRLALRESSVPTVLQQVVQLLGSAMPPGSETAVSVQARGELLCVPTGDTARRLDEAQFAEGHGPVVHAAHSGTAVEIPDVRTDGRWPEHARRSVEAGMLSSLSVPLAVSAQAVGALTIYARATAAFDEGIRRAARRLAPHARAAVASLECRHQARAMADDLEQELATKSMIVQAKWILVERYQLTPERAVELMARMSARSNVELRQIAAGLILKGRGSRA